jgi:catechol 2,3-dioxygenase-like lactoylglutathione lyase family enzyme
VTIERMEHVGIVFDDLEAATAFFVELGFTAGGTSEVEGDWVDRIVGLDDMRVDARMLETPDGDGRLELIKFHRPEAVTGDGAGPANVLGLRHIAFRVDDLDDTLERLKPHGGELIGEVVRYGDIFRLCYLRGPEGIIVELAERL